MSDLYRYEPIDPDDDCVPTLTYDELEEQIGKWVPVTDESLSRAEWESSINRQAIRDTIIENDGLGYDVVTDRIIEVIAAFGEETSDE